ncbi:MAG: helix-turn-helix domain-containing protein [Lentisphaeria bacterium]
MNKDRQPQNPRPEDSKPGARQPRLALAWDAHEAEPEARPDVEEVPEEEIQEEPVVKTSESQSQPEKTVEEPKRVRLPSTDISLGQSLLEGRGACNMSITQVAQKTKIPLSFIEKVEADKIAELPASVYARSYISQLGRLYGMDTEPLLTEYERLSKAEGGGKNKGGVRGFVLGQDGEAGRVRYHPAGAGETDTRRLGDRLSRIAVLSTLGLLVLLVLIAFGVQQYRNFRMRQAEKTIQQAAPATPADASTDLEKFIIPQQLPLRELQIPGADMENGD